MLYNVLANKIVTVPPRISLLAVKPTPAISTINRIVINPTVLNQIFAIEVEMDAEITSWLAYFGTANH